MYDLLVAAIAQTNNVSGSCFVLEPAGLARVVLFADLAVDMSPGDVIVGTERRVVPADSAPYLNRLEFVPP